jgi:hypothetical protein
LWGGNGGFVLLTEIDVALPQELSHVTWMNIPKMCRDKLYGPTAPFAGWRPSDDREDVLVDAGTMFAWTAA